MITVYRAINRPSPFLHQREPRRGLTPHSPDHHRLAQGCSGAFAIIEGQQVHVNIKHRDPIPHISGETFKSFADFGERSFRQLLHVLRWIATLGLAIIDPRRRQYPRRQHLTTGIKNTNCSVGPTQETWTR